ncbi:hypothetical protein F5884DRAFT_745580 [Xylogone sp. PMI_703]|nr:hypothetical protein F5884DRAFT_745580 [Xylogone sp. PMI_703]
MTINTTGIAVIYQQLQNISHVIIDEGNQVNLAEFAALCAYVDFDEVLIIGDDHQLEPVIFNTPHQGFTDELKHIPPQKAYRAVTTAPVTIPAFDPFAALDWSSATGKNDTPCLGIAGLMPTSFFSDEDYRALVISIQKYSTLETPLKLSHFDLPLATHCLNFMKTLFPECQSDLSVRFFELVGVSELRGSGTVSYCNLGSTSFQVNMIEAMIGEGFNPEDLVHITPYHSQVKVYKHSYAKLAHEASHTGFDKIDSYIIDVIQGESISIPFVMPPGLQTKVSLETVVRFSDAFSCAGF